MSEPKFTSFTTADFLNDVDMDWFIDAVEKTAPLWVKEMKSRGLLKFSLNRVWNRGEVFRVVMRFVLIEIWTRGGLAARALEFTIPRWLAALALLLRLCPRSVECVAEMRPIPASVL